jgi:hypothetical protein
MSASTRRLWLRVAQVVLAVEVVRLAVELVGRWPAAVVVGLVLVAAALRAWVRLVEPRLFPRPGPTGLRARATTGAAAGPGRPVDDVGLDGRHVEFARALAGVAAWYLDECEHEQGMTR